MYDDKDSRIDYGVILPVLLLAFISYCNFILNNVFD